MPASFEEVPPELELEFEPPPLEELLLEAPVVPASWRAPASAVGWAPLLELAPPLLDAPAVAPSAVAESEPLLDVGVDPLEDADGGPDPEELVRPLDEPEEPLLDDPGPVGPPPGLAADGEQAHTSAANAVHPAERRKCIV
jgi:hypothetical protein